MADVTDAKSQLLGHIRDEAIVRGRVTLSSGAEADYYVDLRRVSLSGRSTHLVGRVMRELTADLEYDAVGGLTMGADPVATAMMAAAHADDGQVVDAFVVRKAGKAHGLQQRVEGPSIAGRRVLIVEDTATSGASALEAAQAAKDAGASVVAVAVIADRDTGAAERIESAGLPYRAAYGLADLGLA